MVFYNSARLWRHHQPSGLIVAQAIQASSRTVRHRVHDLRILPGIQHRRFRRPLRCLKVCEFLLRLEFNQRLQLLQGVNVLLGERRDVRRNLRV